MYTDIEGFIHKLNVSQNDGTLFREVTWSRDQLFKTVSHNTVDGTFKSPCTTSGGDVVGAPCMFPVLYPDCTECFK